MANVFFNASKDALNNITDAYNFVHPITVSMRYVRNEVASLVSSNPTIDNTGIQDVIDPTGAVHGVDYRAVFTDITWDNQEEKIAWLLLNNLFAIHEGWAQRLYEETFTGYGYTDKFVKNLEMDNLTKKLSSYFLRTGKISSAMDGAFFDLYKNQSMLDFGKLDNYMLCYRCFKEARNCYMHGNFVASSRLITAYNKYLPKATLSALDVGEVPIFIPPVSGQQVRLSLRGVIGFSDILRRIIIISDINLLRATAAEKEFLDRKPNGWTRKNLSSNPAKAEKQITRYSKKMGFLKATWTADYQSFLIRNNIFSR